MEYMGAAEYWFWMGVEAAQGSTLNAEEHPDLSFDIDSMATRESIEAYRWGICFGKVTTKRDFTMQNQSIEIDSSDKYSEHKLEMDEIIKQIADELTKAFEDDVQGHC